MGKARGMLKVNPASAIKPPSTHSTAPHKARPLDEEEYNKLIAWCTAPIRLKADGTVDKNDLYRGSIRDCLLFIAQTGTRCGEAIALRWSDIKGKWATISRSIDVLGNESQTKTKSSRTVPLTPLVLAMLERRKFLGHDFVFATRDGHILARHNVLRAMFQQTGHTIHELRHTYITRAARAGINPRVLQSISGHRTLSVLLNVYTHVSEDDKESAAEKITANGIN